LATANAVACGECVWITHPTSARSPVHRRVHRHGGGLDRGEGALQQRSVQRDADDAVRRQPLQRRGGRVVHLLCARDPEADVAMPVCRDGPARDHPRGRVEDLVDEILVHRRSPRLSRTGRGSRAATRARRAYIIIGLRSWK
jgi:hypothetical protein